MDILSRVLKKILSQNPALKQGVDDARIIDSWAPAVGETIAKHTQAVQVRNKTLIVEVDHPIWKQELLANKALALQKLNKKISEIFGDETGKIWIEDLYLGSLNQTKQKTKLTPPRSK
jgi:predicted nucleic acid-binding Zn ribbon protein